MATWSWSSSFDWMMLFILYKRYLEQTKREGRKEGRKEGRQAGRKGGRKAGRKEGREEGRQEGRKVDLARDAGGHTAQ